MHGHASWPDLPSQTMSDIHSGSETSSPSGFDALVEQLVKEHRLEIARSVRALNVEREELVAEVAALKTLLDIGDVADEAASQICLGVVGSLTGSIVDSPAAPAAPPYDAAKLNGRQEADTCTKERAETAEKVNGVPSVGDIICGARRPSSFSLPGVASVVASSGIGGATDGGDKQPLSTRRPSEFALPSIGTTMRAGSSLPPEVSTARRPSSYVLPGMIASAVAAPSSMSPPCNMLSLVTETVSRSDGQGDLSVMPPSESSHEIEFIGEAIENPGDCEPSRMEALPEVAETESITDAGTAPPGALPLGILPSAPCAASGGSQDRSSLAQLSSLRAGPELKAQRISFLGVFSGGSKDRAEPTTPSSPIQTSSSSDSAPPEELRGPRRGSALARNALQQAMKKEKRHRGLEAHDEASEEDAADIESEEEEEVIQMLAVWKETSAKGKIGARSGTRLGQNAGVSPATNGSKHAVLKSGSQIFVEPEDDIGWFVELLGNFVAKPSSTWRVMWDVIGLVLIGYDLIMIPFQAFDPPRSTFTDILDWFGTVFWTLDIPGSFFVGFQHEGIMNMRVDRIALHYAKTWLPFDLMVVSIDWSLFALGAISQSGSGGNGSQDFGFLRLGKAVKFLRLMRLLRLLKASGVLSEMIDRIQSEWCLIMVGIFKLLVFICMINHVIACAWYGLGSLVDPDEREDSWVAKHIVLKGRMDLSYRYVTALHWSFTQFTPASMEVTPENEMERCFTVLVILFAMVTFSSFVSTITNAMTQLRNLNRERNDQMSILRRYFSENRVSGNLMGRVWGCLQKAMGRSKRRVHESDVVILQLLPWTLKTELQEEVYAPILTAHPFFMQYSTAFRMQMRKVYQNALEEVSLGIGHQLFNSGEISTKMYFVLSGILSYKEEGGRLCGLSFVEGGQWLCEPVLWIIWKHTGQLIATTHCELVALHAQKTQEVLAQHQSETEDMVRSYVKLFTRYFKKHQDSLTDIWADIDLLTEMAFRAFEDDDENEAGIVENENAPTTGARHWFGGFKGASSGDQAGAVMRRKSMWGAGLPDPNALFGVAGVKKFAGNADLDSDSDSESSSAPSSGSTSSSSASVTSEGRSNGEVTGGDGTHRRRSSGGRQQGKKSTPNSGRDSTVTSTTVDGEDEFVHQTAGLMVRESVASGPGASIKRLIAHVRGDDTPQAMFNNRRISGESSLSFPNLPRKDD